jgi:hypothetical protein
VNDALAQLATNDGSLGGSAVATFVRHGEYWSLAYEGEVILLRDAKGLQYLALLLRRAGERISVAELVSEPGTVAGPIDQAGLERHRSAVTKRIRNALQKIEKNHARLGRHLNARVKTGYECSYTLDPEKPVPWQV